MRVCRLRFERGSGRAAWPALTTLAVAVALWPPRAVAQLNDSGQTGCFDNSGSTGSVAPTTPVPASTGFEAQDCTRGRDAAAALGRLAKRGAGVAGFDFGKVGGNGASLAADAALGSGSTAWACTQDFVTGLVWEVKTGSGLRAQAHTYTWYDINTTRNGGNAGSAAGSGCSGSLSQCNTADYVTAVNASALCGFNDWRLPTLSELQSLVHYGAAAAPSIDVSYFPNTASDFYWTAASYAADASHAWAVSFANGETASRLKSSGGYLRLVRGNGCVADFACSS